MDFDAGLLLFLFIFFVLPLIQRVLGGATKQAPPGNQPGQRRPGVPQGQAEGRPRLPDPARTGTPDGPAGDEPVRVQTERAADLIPDDLWEILTGERRTRTPSQHQHAPAAEPESGAQRETGAEWDSDAEEVWQPERTAAPVPTLDEAERYQEPGPLETPKSPVAEEITRSTTTTGTPSAPATASGRVSPAATPRPSSYAIAETVAASTPSRARPHGLEAARRRPMSPSLSNRSDLKRAFVLREVLGPPKALE